MFLKKPRTGVLGMSKIIALCALMAAVHLAPASGWCLAPMPLGTSRLDASFCGDPLQQVRAPSAYAPRRSQSVSRDSASPYMGAAPAAQRWAPKSGKKPLVLLIGFMGATPAIMVCCRVPSLQHSPSSHSPSFCCRTPSVMQAIMADNCSRSCAEALDKDVVRRGSGDG